MRGLLLLLAGLLVLPSGTAQQDPLGPDLSLELEGPTAPVRPEAPVRILATVAARCDKVLAALPTTQPGQPAELRILFQATNGVMITGPTAIPINATSCAPSSPGTTHVTVQAEFQLVIPRTAPGLQALAAVGRAELGDAETDPTPFTVTAEYFSLNQVKLARKLVSCAAPCTVDFDLEVTNFGNARTQYDFELGTQPSGGQWNALLPEVLLVESPNSAQNVSPGSATFKVAVPQGGGEGAFQLIIKPSAADDPRKAGNPLTVNVLVRDTSLASRVTPGPDPLLIGLAALVATTLARRRA